MASGNRVRQARRHAKLSQRALAERVGVHRSAVAQWEQANGSHPTMEHIARISLATCVSSEWLMTGRGRMKYRSDILLTESEDESPALLLQHSAQSETEERALMAMRRLPNSILLPIVEMLESLTRPTRLKLVTRAGYSR